MAPWARKRPARSNQQQGPVSPVFDEKCRRVKKRFKKLFHALETEGETEIFLQQASNHFKYLQV